MKKNLLLMLSLSAIVLLAGCNDQKVENSDIDNTWDDTIVTNDNIGSDEENEFTESYTESSHSDWVATSLSLEDLERIEESMPPISYDYESYDMQKEETVDSGTKENEEWRLYIPEYETMVSREIVSSGIEDDMIYTLVNITLEDGNVLQALYVNEPSTLFCRAISIMNGDLNTLYSNFVYAADIQ